MDRPALPGGLLAAQDPVAARIVRLTLEILCLLTGEDYMVVKKPSECVSSSSHHNYMTETRTQSPRAELPPHSLIQETRDPHAELPPHSLVQETRDPHAELPPHSLIQETRGPNKKSTSQSMNQETRGPSMEPTPHIQTRGPSTEPTSQSMNRETRGPGTEPTSHSMNQETRGPSMEPPPHIQTRCPSTEPTSQSRERHNEQKILALTIAIIQLLTGEVPVRCEDVTVYLSMEEWEYLEGHKELYQDVLTEDHPPLRSLGGKKSIRSASPENDDSKRKEEAKCSWWWRSRQNKMNQPHYNLSRSSLCKGGSEDVHTPNECPPDPLNEDSPFHGGDPTAINSPTDQTPYLMAPVNEDSPFHDGGAINTPTDHTQTPCLSARIGSEQPSWTGPPHIDVYTPPEYPAIYINGELVSHQGADLHETCRPAVHIHTKCTSSPLDGDFSSREDLPYADLYLHADRTQAQYPSVHIKEEPAAGEGGGGHYIDIYIPTECPPDVKEEPASCEEEDLPDIGFGASAPYMCSNMKEECSSPGEDPDLYCSSLRTLYGSARTCRSPSSNQDGNYQKGKTHPCPECGKHFHYRSKLIRHRRLHTGEKPFGCSVCGKCFTQASSLSTHRRRHTGEKPFVCFQCGKCYTDNKNLVKHFKLHTRDEEFVCPECGRGFRSVAELVSHQGVHVGEKPFSCSVCGKSFSCKAHVMRHQITHTGEKPFSCPYCGKSFARNATLAAHQRIHTGEKPFPCGVCGKYFRYKSHFNRHMRIHRRNHVTESGL